MDLVALIARTESDRGALGLHGRSGTATGIARDSKQIVGIGDICGYHSSTPRRSSIMLASP